MVSGVILNCTKSVLYNAIGKTTDTSILRESTLRSDLFACFLTVCYTSVIAWWSFANLPSVSECIKHISNRRIRKMSDGNGSFHCGNVVVYTVTNALFRGSTILKNSPVGLHSFIQERVNSKSTKAKQDSVAQKPVDESGCCEKRIHTCCKQPLCQTWRWHKHAELNCFKNKLHRASVKFANRQANYCFVLSLLFMVIRLQFNDMVFSNLTSLLCKRRMNGGYCRKLLPFSPCCHPSVDCNGN